MCFRTAPTIYRNQQQKIQATIIHNIQKLKVHKRLELARSYKKISKWKII